MRLLLQVHRELVESTIRDLDEAVAVAEPEFKPMMVQFQNRVRKLLNDFDEAVDAKDGERLREVATEFKGLEDEFHEIERKWKEKPRDYKPKFA